MNTVTLWIDGAETKAAAGVPLGAVLHRLLQARLRRTIQRGELRGLFCGMGTCFDCLVTIDGQPGQRACITPVAAGMRVETNIGKAA